MKVTSRALQLPKLNFSYLKPSPFRKEIVKILLLVLIFVGLIFSSLLGYQRIYADKIYPNVQIASFKVGGKTKAQALEYLKRETEKLLKQEVSLSLGTTSQQIPLENLAVNFNIEKTIDQAFNAGKTDDLFQNLKFAFQSLFKKEHANLELTFNEQKLSESLKVFSEPLPKPENANLKYENGGYTISASKSGLAINLEQFKKDLSANLQNGQFQITLVTEKALPEITETQTLDAKAKAEKIISKPLILNFENKTFEASKDEIASWLKFENKDGKLEALLDNDKILEFIEKMAKKIDIKAQNREILQSGAVLQEGKEGRALNRQLTINAIQDILNSNKERKITLQVDVIQPSEKIIKNPNAQAGRFSGKYIDINLSAQVLTIFEGENQLGAYRVSTGRWSTPTPIGTRYVQGHTLRAYSSRYNLYLPYWLSIGGGYGIHELPEWPSGAKEGESHLGTPVSHGCVRLGVGPAETVYNWADDGTPVYIHY